MLSFKTGRSPTHSLFLCLDGQRKSLPLCLLRQRRGDRGLQFRTGRSGRYLRLGLSGDVHLLQSGLSLVLLLESSCMPYVVPFCPVIKSFGARLSKRLVSVSTVE